MHSNNSLESTDFVIKLLRMLTPNCARFNNKAGKLKVYFLINTILHVEGWKWKRSKCFFYLYTLRPFLLTPLNVNFGAFSNYCLYWLNQNFWNTYIHKLVISTPHTKCTECQSKYRNKCIHLRWTQKTWQHILSYYFLFFSWGNCNILPYSKYIKEQI